MNVPREGWGRGLVVAAAESVLYWVKLCLARRTVEADPNWVAEEPGCGDLRRDIDSKTWCSSVDKYLKRLTSHDCFQ